MRHLALPIALFLAFVGSLAANEPCMDTAVTNVGNVSQSEVGDSEELCPLVTPLTNEVSAIDSLLIGYCEPQRNCQPGCYPDSCQMIDTGSRQCKVGDHVILCPGDSTVWRMVCACKRNPWEYCIRPYSSLGWCG
jgi:hypothetical protein